MLLLTTPYAADLPPPTVPAPTPWCPSQAELAALGPVLCTWRQSFGSELHCLARMRVAKACIQLSPLGLSEWIACLTAEGQCCMRIHPLPEATQRDAWRRLMERLPAECQVPSLGDGCARLLVRMGDWLRGDDWKGSALAFRDGQRPAATLATLGPRDADAAHAILLAQAATGVA